MSIFQCRLQRNGTITSEHILCSVLQILPHQCSAALSLSVNQNQQCMFTTRPDLGYNLTCIYLWCRRLHTTTTRKWWTPMKNLIILPWIEIEDACITYSTLQKTGRSHHCRRPEDYPLWPLQQKMGHWSPRDCTGWSMQAETQVSRQKTLSGTREHHPGSNSSPGCSYMAAYNAKQISSRKNIVDVTCDLCSGHLRLWSICCSSAPFQRPFGSVWASKWDRMPPNATSSIATGRKLCRWLTRHVYPAVLLATVEAAQCGIVFWQEIMSPATIAHRWRFLRRLGSAMLGGARIIGAQRVEDRRRNRNSGRARLWPYISDLTATWGARGGR